MTPTVEQGRPDPCGEPMAWVEDVRAEGVGRVVPAIVGGPKRTRYAAT